MIKTQFIESNSHSQEMHKKDVDFLTDKSQISTWKAALMVVMLVAALVALTVISSNAEITSYVHPL
jgi:hypothetical protein